MRANCFLAALLVLCVLSQARPSGKELKVVYVMMENRSFDHMLGYLKKKNPDINGLTGDETNPYNTTEKTSKLQAVNDRAIDVDPDASHSITGTTEQVFGCHKEGTVALMNGFVQNAENKVAGWGPQVMACHSPEHVPILSTLAEEFAVFDKWFASVPGPTEVNRAYATSGTSHGMGTNDRHNMTLGFVQDNLFTRLHEKKVSWKVYMEVVSSTLLFRWNRHPIDALLHYHFMHKFVEDAKHGRLPSFSWLDPHYFDASKFYANDQHPSHSVWRGEKFLKKVYEAVRNGPDWNNTLLIITYDEHGGLYDHVPTPLTGVPNPDGIESTNPPFAFKRLGVRVPTVMVSPWISKGTVVHEPKGPTPTSHYDHTSTIATLRALFDLGDPLTDRDAWAGTFEHILETRDSPRTDCPATLPDVYETHLPSFDEVDEMTSWQDSLVAMVEGLLSENTHNFNSEMQAGDYLVESMQALLKDVVTDW